MTEAAKSIEEHDGPGLDDMLQEWEEEVAATEAEEAQPTKEEVERARKLAEKMNSGFLWLVNRTQCPHVAINDIVDREQGDEAFLGLAEKWGGEVPPWMEALQPYIAAGVYMGTTIVTAKQAEAMVIEQARQRAQQQEAGAANGAESESRPGE